MYPLKNAPIFLEFLDTFLKKANSKIKIKHSNKIFLYDKCLCHENSCNTFVLRTTKQIDFNYYVCHTIETNKGTFGIELLNTSEMLFIATNNTNLPFKKEFKTFFNNKRTINKTIQNRKNINKLSSKNKQALHMFFKDLEIISSVYLIDETIDNCLKDYV